MAEELGDLSADSINFALTAWKRGDASGLTSYQQDHARIGTFFPKPAELRTLAKVFLRKKRMADEQRAREEEYEAMEKRRRDHPEEYVSVRSIVVEVAEKKKLDIVQKAAAPKPAPKCTGCGAPIQLRSLTATGFAMMTPADLRALADVRERQIALESDATERDLQSVEQSL
jgi:hypothetical protein